MTGRLPDPVIVATRPSTGNRCSQRENTCCRCNSAHSRGSPREQKQQCAASPGAPWPSSAAPRLRLALRRCGCRCTCTEKSATRRLRWRLRCVTRICHDAGMDQACKLCTMCGGSSIRLQMRCASTQRAQGAACPMRAACMPMSQLLISFSATAGQGRNAKRPIASCNLQAACCRDTNLMICALSYLLDVRIRPSRERRTR